MDVCVEIGKVWFWGCCRDGGGVEMVMCVKIEWCRDGVGEEMDCRWNLEQKRQAPHKNEMSLVFQYTFKYIGFTRYQYSNIESDIILDHGQRSIKLIHNYRNPGQVLNV